MVPLDFVDESKSESVAKFPLKICTFHPQANPANEAIVGSINWEFRAWLLAWKRHSSGRGSWKGEL